MNPPARTAASRRRRLGWWTAAGVVLTLVVLVGVGEARRWPWLSGPVTRLLAGALDRDVSLGAGEGQGGRFSLLGGVRIWADTLQIGAPSWSQAPYMVRAEQAYLQLSYHDLWRAYRGRPVLVERLQAERLQAHLERLRDGRASWQFGPPRPDKPPARSLDDGLHFDVLRINRGEVSVRDEPQAVRLQADLSLHVRNHRRAGRGDSEVPEGLRATAQGMYRQFPLQARVSSGQLASWMLGHKGRQAWPVQFHLSVGRARLDFEGTVDQLTLDADVRGRFRASGPSLSAVGEPLGVVLPTTHAFAMRGDVRHRGDVSHVAVAGAEIGSSRLGGEFTFDRRPQVPLLTGRLSGARLALGDLAPAIGVPDKPATARREGGPVLPDREFDLPSLRAMNADVVVDIRQLDLNSDVLKPLEPLKGRVHLASAVLTLADLTARTAQGQLNGRLTLDAREQKVARWDADLSVKDVRVQEWIPALAPAGRPPYLAGRLDGRALVKGRGRSTAAILGSLDGSIQAHLREGAVSHLGIEAAGIDLAQALGVLIKGDEPLPIPCARADLKAQDGVLTPRLFVATTPDSTVWIQGRVSLKDEQLALEAKVAPKDFSVVSLRTPVQVTGPLSKPKVAVQAKGLVPRVAGAVALGLLNPVAAIIPLMDPGNKELARQADEACRRTAMKTIPRR